jgi:hypothetical protein
MRRGIEREIEIQSRHVAHFVEKSARNVAGKTNEFWRVVKSRAGNLNNYSQIPPEELQDHSHTPNLVVATVPNPDINPVDPTPDNNQPTQTGANPDTDQNQNNQNGTNDLAGDNAPIDQNNRNHSNNHRHPWLTAGMTLALLAGVGALAKECTEDQSDHTTPIVLPSPTLITRIQPNFNISYPPMPTPKETAQITQAPTSEPTQEPTAPTTPEPPVQTPTPEPTTIATPSATNIATESPLASAEVLQDFEGKPGEQYTLNGWYLIDGDVFVKGADSNTFIQTYDNNQFTAEEIIAGTGNVITGSYGFYAHAIPYDLSSVDVYSDQMQQFISDNMSNKFSQVIQGPDGPFQVDTINLDVLDPSGEIINIETANRELE